MKKLLLASAISVLAASASANEGTFYVRGDVGASMLPKQSVKFSGITDKLKSSTHVVGNIGVGTYLMDNVRTELNLSSHFGAKQSYNNKELAEKGKYKVNVSSLTLKGLVDVYDYGMGKVFAGVGLGLSQVSAKDSYEGGSATLKKKNNFSYLLTAGTGFDVSEGVVLDLAYSFNDHGKVSTKSPEVKRSLQVRSHDLTAGVRVEL